MPPARASGLIRKKGTAVVTTFNLFVCADTIAEKKHDTTIPKLNLEAVDLIISKNLNWCANIAALQFYLKILDLGYATKE